MDREDIQRNTLEGNEKNYTNVRCEKGYKGVAIFM
jgi:hypothetical protein